jgi:hypothetical protein
MRRYDDADEEAVRTAMRVRDWKESGLLDAGRAEAIESELRTGLRRTHWALRAVLFFFTVSVIQSAVGFVFIVLGLPAGAAVSAALALIAGLGCFWIADFLIAKYGLYRFGVEEASAVCSIALITVGMTLGASMFEPGTNALAVVALVTGSLTGGVVYWRFGLVYCALLAAASASAVAFVVGFSEIWSRLLAAGVLLGIHSVAGQLRQPFDDDYPGDDYGVIESAAWLGAYLLINLELPALFTGPQPAVPPAFFWGTYAAVWFLPIIGLYRGLRRKHHWMIRANLLMLLGTLVTNKLYLGWERHTWDPIVLGLLLVAAALGVRRWLLSGPGGQRYGFTPHRLLSSDLQAMTQLSYVTAALKPDETVRDTGGAEAYKPGGGRSGGAGASGGF